MSERVVIAQLVIDEKGAVDSVQQTGRAVAGLERQTTSSANVFTNRMFNMRTAAMAFLGTFTLAGVIYAFKNFVENVIKASSEFHKFSAASAEAFKNLTKFVLEVTPVNSVLSGTTAWLERISGAFALLRGAASQEESGLGSMWEFLWGLTPVGKIMDMLTLLGKAIDKIAPGLRAAGREPYIPRATRLPEGDAWMQPYSTVRELTENATLAAMDYAESLSYVTEAHRNWMSVVNETGSIIEENITEPMNESWRAIAQHVEMTRVWQETLAAGMSLIGHSIADSGLTSRKALSMLLQQMSQMAFAFAAMHVAAALGATTFLGAAITGGTTAQHAAAAAKWFAAGAVTAVLASHYGSSGGSRGGVSAYGGGQEIRGSVPHYAITFNVEGNVIANEDWTRQQTIWIKRALADGAGGGSL